MHLAQRGFSCGPRSQDDVSVASEQLPATIERRCGEAEVFNGPTRVDLVVPERRPALRMHFRNNHQACTGAGDRTTCACQGLKLSALDIHANEGWTNLQPIAHVINRDDFNGSCSRPAGDIDGGSERVDVWLVVLIPRGLLSTLACGRFEQEDGGGGPGRLDSEVAAGDRRAPRGRLECYDTPAGTSKAGFEHGVNSKERSDVQYHVSWRDMLFQKREQRLLGAVRP